MQMEDDAGEFISHNKKNKENEERKMKMEDRIRKFLKQCKIK